MANVSVSNTPGLYIGSGASAVLNSAQQLLSLLSNQGNVNFALATGNSTVQGFFVGTSGSTYSNANVAAYLPVNSANVAGAYFTGNGSTLTGLTGAAAGTYGSDVVIPTIVVDATGRITSITTNAASGGGSYGNANVAAFLPTYTGSLALSSTIVTLDANVGTLFLGNASTNANLGAFQTFSNANAASQATAINTLDANLGTATTNITTLFSNAATQAGQIDTLNANLGAFQTYANNTFGTSSYSNVQVAAFLPTYTGNIGNVSMTTGKRYIYGGNIEFVANAAGPSQGSILFQTINATNGAINQGNISLAADRVEMGYGVNPHSRITLLGYTLIRSGNGSALAGGTTTGNVLTVAQGNLSLINNNGLGGNDSNGGGYLWVSNNISAAGSITAGTTMNTVDITATGRATAGNITTTAGLFWANGQSVLTSIPGTYSNSNVAAYLVSSTSIITNSNNSVIRIQNTANTAALSIGNFGFDTATLQSANVTLAGTGTYPINIDNSLANVEYSGSFHNFRSLSGSSLNTTSVKVFGNVQANQVFSTTGYFWSNGTAYSTGGGGSYGNTEVAAYLLTSTGNIAGNSVSLTFNSSANRFVSNTGYFWANGTAYVPPPSSSFTSNVTLNGNFLQNTIIETTTEKTANIGALTGTITINANTGPIQTATLVGNITINTNNMTNFNTGESVTLVLTQDGTGSRLLTSNLKYAGGSKTLSTAAASIDTISITYDGTNYLAALVKGYA
jgi:hypothetical protein